MTNNVFKNVAQSRSCLSSRRASFSCLAEIAEDIGPGFLEVGVTLQSTLQHASDAVLGFGPRQRCSKRSEGVQEPIGWGQRDFVNETLPRGDGAPVEGGDPARERVDEAVQLRVRKRTVDVPVSFRGIPIEVVRAENNFKRAATTDQRWEAFRTAAARMQSHPDFGLAQSRVLARREAHVAGKDKLAANAPDAAPDLCDANHRGLGETDKRIHQDREAGAPNSRHDVSRLAG